MLGHACKELKGEEEERGVRVESEEIQKRGRRSVQGKSDRP